MNRFAKSLAFPLILAASAMLFQNCGSRSKYPKDKYIVRMETSKGNMVLELYNQTPKHRDNFVKLAKQGFYDGTAFHRIISQFMVQGGDPETRSMHPDSIYGTHDAGYTVPAEFVPNLYHLKGALAAARSGDNVNPKKESSGSQFYIVEGKKQTAEALKSIAQRRSYKHKNAMANEVAHKFYMEHIQNRSDIPEQELRRLIDSVGQKAFNEVPEFSYPDSIALKYQTMGGAPHLDGDYTVYGQVIEGLNVLDSIAHVETGARDMPREKVLIKKVEIIQIPKAKK